MSSKEAHSFEILFCFPFRDTVHPTDIFYLDYILIDVIPCCLVGGYQHFRGKCVVVRIKKQLMKKAVR
jgi:hypothetical protein